MRTKCEYYSVSPWLQFYLTRMYNCYISYPYMYRMQKNSSNHLVGCSRRHSDYERGDIWAINAYCHCQYTNTYLLLMFSQGLHFALGLVLE